MACNQFESELNEWTLRPEKGLLTQLTMKTITFSADEGIIEKARLVARAQGKTLNTAFREWLAEFIGLSGNAKKAELLMRRLGHVKAARVSPETK
jgi:hypothetical protein